MPIFSFLFIFLLKIGHCFTNFNPQFILYLRLFFSNKNKWGTKNEQKVLEESKINKRLKVVKNILRDKNYNIKKLRDLSIKNISQVVLKVLKIILNSPATIKKTI